MKCISRCIVNGLGVLMFGICTSVSVHAAETVRLAQNLSPISGVTIVAKHKGFFEEQGLDVEVSNFTSGKQCLQTVQGGGADIATTAEAPTTAAAMAKEPIAFLARTEYSDLKTLTAEHSKIGSLQDLKGKKIAFSAGTGSEVYTQALLKKAGLTTEDVQLVNLRPQDMAPALASGSIDAFNTWEPYIANTKRVMGDKAALLDTKGIYAETFNIVVMKDYLEKNQETVQNFLKALIKAEQWMKANRSEAIEVVANAVNLKPADLEPIWDDYVYEVVLDQRVLDVLHAHAEWRLETGNAPTKASMPDFMSIIDTGPLKSIAPERVRL
ncbi:NrtA/SsuA/CpmA family ABC transporter substrate-binding protein [Allohahella marinimesophila]|uniref:NrtA/SsuA/CpmA family ABC transporter substrate-binding protein n=1 Tax=Allohahella marinimesophila TaxID=1054972 RepID=A0ABP7PHM0_9GAMM